jgi:hypothetical protein
MSQFPPRVRMPHRPYSRKRGGPPSVTTVLDTLGKPGLSWAAAKETALRAVNHPDTWQQLDNDKAVDYLRVWHRGLWDGRAAVGTAVHRVNEEWTWGNEVDVEQVMLGILAEPRPPKIWQGREDETLTELLGYVDGLEQFWHDFQPDTVATEEVLRHPDKYNSYIGQRDWVCRIDGETALLDIKTTAEPDAEKAIYQDSWRLQLSAYRFAEELVYYDADGTETGTAKSYPIGWCGIVHLRGDGSYQLYRVQAGGSEHTRFLQLRGLYEWVQRESKKPPAEIVRPKGTEEMVA